MTTSTTAEQTPERRSRWRFVLPAAVVIVWLFVGGPLGSFTGRLAEVQSNDNASFLPSDAESTRVTESRRVSGADGSPGDHHLGERRPERDAAGCRLRPGGHRIAGRSRRAGQSADPVRGRAGAASDRPPIRISAKGLIDVVEEIRTARGHARRRGIRRGTGRHPCGLRRCLRWDRRHPARHCRCSARHPAHRLSQPRAAFPRAPERAARLGVASAVVYFLADSDIITLNGQSQGILSILAVGAATDYALLLTARFREELRENRDRFAAMRVALRQSSRRSSRRAAP